MGKLNKLSFPLTSEIVVKYPSMQLIQNGELILPIWSEDYKSPTYSNVEVSYGFTSPVIKNSKVPYEFEATCREGRLTSYIKWIFQDLIAIAISDPCKYRAITLHDYCLHDTLDDQARGYTVRTGVLNFEMVAGSFRSDNGANSHPGGIRILFTQL
jgi:hypothetical protein